MKNNLGAIFTVYKNKKATRFVLENFKKFFPDSPIVLISDGGDDFSDLATEFSCSYYHMENLYGDSTNNYPTLPYNKERMLRWWDRLNLSVHINNTKYMMILEDDVYVKDNFEIPDINLAGVRIGNYFSNEMLKEIKENNPDLNFSNNYGMCGGSIFNCDIFRLIYDDVVLDIKENHDKLLESNKEYFLLGAVDANITYHFNKRGYPYSHAPWLAEKRERDCNNFPVVHQWKDHY